MRSRSVSGVRCLSVGASGPLVGFAVAIPILIYGVVHSRVVPGIVLPPRTCLRRTAGARLLAHDFFLELIRLRFCCILLVVPLGWNFRYRLTSACRTTDAGIFWFLNRVGIVAGGWLCREFFLALGYFHCGCGGFLGRNFAGVAISAHSTDLRSADLLDAPWGGLVVLAVANACWMILGFYGQCRCGIGNFSLTCYHSRYDARARAAFFLS